MRLPLRCHHIKEGIWNENHLVRDGGVNVLTLLVKYRIHLPKTRKEPHTKKILFSHQRRRIRHPVDDILKKEVAVQIVHRQRREVCLLKRFRTRTGGKNLFHPRLTHLRLVGHDRGGERQHRITCSSNIGRRHRSTGWRKGQSRQRGGRRRRG